jgi:hypothetical protein
VVVFLIRSSLEQEEVIVARKNHALRHGKDQSILVKSQLKRLPQVDDTWEADFRALPKPMEQSETDYLGMVVAKKGDAVLAKSLVEGRPKATDLATLLVHAMSRPQNGEAHRPHRLHVRGHKQWQELVPHLEQLGIDVSVRQELAKITTAYKEHLRQLHESHRASMVRPTPKQEAVEKLFPTVAS